MTISRKYTQMAKSLLASKSSRLASVSRKERLFEDFYINLLKTSERIENLFGVDGVRQQVFRCDHSFGDPEDGEAKENLRANRAWLLVSELYDYAVEGIDRTFQRDSTSDDASSLVIDAGEVIALLTGEEDAPLEAWHEIVAMGDARVALDEGMGIRVESLSLLANVDVRTVRNAISSGALECNKDDDPYVGNESARLWLSGRRGFRPTVCAGNSIGSIDDVHSPERFGAFLKRCRSARPVASTQELLLAPYPGLTSDVLAEVEAGVFRVPLSLVAPLANFYGVPRGDLLDSVMRVFFPEELQLLTTRVYRDRLTLIASDSRSGGSE